MNESLSRQGGHKMHTGGDAKQWISFLRSQGDVSRLATAAAILICVAIILNVGPFSSEKTHGGPGQKIAVAVTQESTEWSHISRMDVEDGPQQDSAASGDHQDHGTFETLKDGFELASMSAPVDTVTVASQPIARKDRI